MPDIGYARISTMTPCLNICITKTVLQILGSMLIFGLLVFPTYVISSAENHFTSMSNCPKSNYSYTLGSTFQSNLNYTLFTELPAKASRHNYYNFTRGTGIDQVYALYYCRGNVGAQGCQDCIQSAAKKIEEGCKFLKEGIVWFEECTLRYANRTIFFLDEETPFFTYENKTGIMNDYDLDPFITTFDSTMDGLIKQAAQNGSLEGFATTEVNLSSSKVLRCIVQCTPDIIGVPCDRCLRAALRQKDSWANSMIFLPSCFIRFDLYRALPVPAPPVPPPGGLSVVLIVLGTTTVVGAFLIGLYFCFRKLLVSRGSGQYSINSGHAWLTNNKRSLVNLSKAEQNFWKRLWAFDMQPKWKIFVWRIMYYPLAIKHNQTHRGFDKLGACSLCAAHEESLVHLFRDCQIAQHVWRASTLGLISGASGSGELREWVMDVIDTLWSTTSRKDAVLSFIATLWSIWIHRNNIVFNNEVVSPIWIVDNVRKVIEENNQVLAQKNLMGRYNNYECTELPPRLVLALLGEIKELDAQAVILKIGGAWKKDKLRSAGAWVGWSADNRVKLGGGVTSFDAVSSLHAELLACISGLRWASNKNINSVVCYTNSVRFVHILKGCEKDPEEYKKSTQELLRLGKRFENCTIIKVDRVEVEEAHSLATECRKGRIPSDCF